jgi:hypothetical protein
LIFKPFIFNAREGKKYVFLIIKELNKIFGMAKRSGGTPN